MNPSTLPSITITGIPGSGKSALARAIQEALREHGITCKLTGFESTEDPTIDATWQKRLTRLNGQTIDITTVCTFRDEFDIAMGR